MAQGGNRQKRKRRQQGRRDPAAPRPTRAERQRTKDDEARAALEPLEPGERPTAVTIGAVVAAAGVIGNLVALATGFETSEGESQPGVLILGAVVAALVAVGMWGARYWAVLGMQTLLAFTIIGASIALTGVNTLGKGALVLLILGLALALFWSLVKAMARIQMPERPGAQRRE